jgi:small subunit ribosomal protein S6
MRHYEVVFLVHPDQSEQVPGMLQRYRTLIENGGGTVHRTEDWGRRQLAYTINKLHKAHYALLNIECDAASLKALEEAFRFNDAVLRHLIVRRETPITAVSPLMRDRQEKDAREREQQRLAAERAMSAVASQEGEESSPGTTDPETATEEASVDEPTDEEDGSP